MFGSWSNFGAYECEHYTVNAFLSIGRDHDFSRDEHAVVGFYFSQISVCCDLVMTAAPELRFARRGIVMIVDILELISGLIL